MWRRAPGEVDLQKKTPRVFCYDCGDEWVLYIALPPLAELQKEGKKLKNKDKDKDKDTLGKGGRAILIGYRKNILLKL